MGIFAAMWRMVFECVVHVEEGGRELSGGMIFFYFLQFFTQFKSKQKCTEIVCASKNGAIIFTYTFYTRIEMKLEKLVKNKISCKCFRWLFFRKRMMVHGIMLEWMEYVEEVLCSSNIFAVWIGVPQHLFILFFLFRWIFRLFSKLILQYFEYILMCKCVYLFHCFHCDKYMFFSYSRYCSLWNCSKHL